MQKQPYRLKQAKVDKSFASWMAFLLRNSRKKGTSLRIWLVKSALCIWMILLFDAWGRISNQNQLLPSCYKCCSFPLFPLLAHVVCVRNTEMPVGTSRKCSQLCKQLHSSEFISVEGRERSILNFSLTTFSSSFLGKRLERRGVHLFKETCNA